jgi:DNA-3-methyladenine glycosylase
MPIAPDTHSHKLFGASIDRSFFARRPEVVARELLGAVLVSAAGGVETAGRIVETEAYLGSDDAGSHAATRGITPRNAVMYGPPGVAYVYFTYGNHHMINLLCEPDGTAGAVLIRALEPLVGIEAMGDRRHGRPLRELCNGPGKLAAALGITLADNAIPLGEGRLSVYYGDRFASTEIVTSGRIGLSSGHELMLRWYVENSSFVSPGKPGHGGRGARRTKKEGAE